ASLWGFASTSSAQNEVPGGWAPQVGFQSFSGGGFLGVSSYQGFGSDAIGPSAPFGGFVGLSIPITGSTFSPFQGQPYVVNGLVPLADTIRRHGRRRAAK